MDTTAYRIGDLAVWRHGPQQKSEIVLVHGLGEHSGRHAPTIAYLRNHGFTVVRFDLRGCGQSGGERQWISCFDEYVQDLAAVFAASQASEKFVLGHSLGGAIAIHFSACRPAGLEGLLLSAPAYLSGGGVSGFKVALAKKLARFFPHAKVAGSLDLTALSREPGVAAAYEQDPLNCRFNTLRQGVEILHAMEQLPGKCRSIPVPVFLAHGGADRLIRSQGSARLFELFPNPDKAMEVFPGGYHELHNDTCREEYFESLGRWLAGHT